jgi:hypothetical protein
MLFYNVAVAGVLAFAGFGHDLHGILLSPAVAFHFVMAAWCAVRLLRHGFFPREGGSAAANTIGAATAAMPKGE